MNKKYRYDYNAESKIMHKRHFESVTMDDLIESWDYAIDNNLIPVDVQGYLLEYTVAVLDLQMGDADRMVAYFNAHPHEFKGRKVAVVVDTPQNIIHPLLAQTKSRDYELKVVSSVEAANVWLSMWK